MESLFPMHLKSWTELSGVRNRIHSIGCETELFVSSLQVQATAIPTERKYYCIWYDLTFEILLFLILYPFIIYIRRKLQMDCLNCRKQMARLVIMVIFIYFFNLLLTYEFCLCRIWRVLCNGLQCHVILWLTLQPWRWRRHILQKRLLTFSGLHDVISQKVELFENHLVPIFNSSTLLLTVSDSFLFLFCVHYFKLCSIFIAFMNRHSVSRGHLEETHVCLLCSSHFFLY
jgi:hypothetical protein